MNSKPKHIDQDAWDAVASPELTDDELARMKPAREVLKPALFEKLTKGRGPQKKPTKEAVSLRLDSDVVEHFRAMGTGWQTKINEALRESVAAGSISVVPKGDYWIVLKDTAGRAKTLGTFSTKAAAVKAAKGLKNPASLTAAQIRAIGAAALTQSTDKVKWAKTTSVRHEKKRA
jgi:uncharacterized protein (DUF4415 family)